MAKLLPFTGHVVANDGANAVVAPPYDALSPEQRTAMAAADPRSFLNVLPPDRAEARADREHTLHGCRRNLDRLLHDGHFRPIPAPSLAVVAFGAGRDRATAIVGDLDAAAFAPTAGAEQVLPHERVREDRVADLVRYLEVVGVASTPVALTHRPHAAVTAATAAVVRSAPDVAYRDDDGTDVALWLVADAGHQADLLSAVEAAGRLYVADGHHRAAAVAAHDPTGRVLSALLPGDQLRILPFHRRLTAVDTLDATQLARFLTDRGIVLRPLPTAAAPTRPGEIHLALAGHWWAADLRGRMRRDDPVEALDVRLAEREQVTPLRAHLAADAEAADVRVTAVAAPLGLPALEGPDPVGIALAPPSLEDLLRVAEAGATMPPKSTYVLPKLRSGLLVVPR